MSRIWAWYRRYRILADSIQSGMTQPKSLALDNWGEALCQLVGLADKVIQHGFHSVRVLRSGNNVFARMDILWYNSLKPCRRR
jgi:hypothetical protein